MAGDPFATAALRGRVLDAWTASPARFREDANAEEDQALGGYHDRLVVELAQNAADAATRAGVPGRLLLAVGADPDAATGLALVAANTGAPLDAQGVEALATLRASAKRDDDPATVGRFGVGFAATLAVTDSPALRSIPGGVRWSAAQTRAAVAQVPALADELARREGHVPVLRLPFPDDAPPPDGFDSVVVLPLRDVAAVDLVRRQLALVGPVLMLMLPALAEVVVRDGEGPERTYRAGDLDVVRVDADGSLDPSLLADRPTEERHTQRWWVSWAYPRPAAAPAVLHAPTPTDEPVDLPALLLGSFPLEPTRRHVAAGPLRDLLVAQAAVAYVDLVRQLARECGADGPEEVLGLVPGPVAAGALDAELHQAVLALLPDAAVLPGGLTARDAVAVDGLPEAAADLLSGVVEGLLPPAWTRHRAIDRLGVHRLRLADLVDDLAALDRPAAWWRELYDTLGGADREALAGLPVPLVDGRLVRGPRGTVLPEPGGPDALSALNLSALGFRVVDPEAVAPLLVTLGAVAADPRGLLDDPVVRSAVEASIEADDPSVQADVAVAVLGLARDAGLRTGDLPWLAALALPDDEGEWVPAGELLLPDGVLAGLVDPDVLGAVDPSWVAAWGDEVLAAVGAMATLAVLRDDDVTVDPDVSDHDLDAEDEWLDDLLDVLPPSSDGLPPVIRELVAVRDLDLVRDDAWPAALRVLAADPELRAAVVDRTRVVSGDGRSTDVEPYAAWWLRTHPVLAGRRPDSLRAAGTDALAGLLDEAPDLGLDAGFLAGIGVVTSVAQVAASPMELPLLRAGVDPSGAGPDRPGEQRPVPGVVGRALPGAPTSYVEHDELTVAGVAVDWWVTAEGQVHAATLDGLARGLAWAAGRWAARLLVAAVLAEPERGADLLAEGSWD